MLDPCQVQLTRASGPLLMGPGTPYTVLPGWDPWSRTTRANQSGARAWAHGSYSGAEWTDEALVLIPLSVNGEGRDRGAWLEAHQDLSRAFASIGDSTEVIELAWEWGGAEYVMFGRPRQVRVSSDHVAVGKAMTQCAFVAPDPRIYSADLLTVSTGLPLQEGGLTLPLTIPFTIGGVLVGGREVITNAGTTATGIVLRIDGPVVDPRVVLQRPDGTVQSVSFDLTLAEGQWLEIDSTKRLALLNGLPGSNQRGRATWDLDSYPLLPGDTNLRFMSSEYNSTALVTAWWRHAWI